VKAKRSFFVPYVGIKGVKECCHLHIFRCPGGMISFFHIFPLPVNEHVHVVDIF